MDLPGFVLLLWRRCLRSSLSLRGTLLTAPQCSILSSCPVHSSQLTVPSSLNVKQHKVIDGWMHKLLMPSQTMRGLGQLLCRSVRKEGKRKRIRGCWFGQSSDESDSAVQLWVRERKREKGRKGDERSLSKWCAKIVVVVVTLRYNCAAIRNVSKL